MEGRRRYRGGTEEWRKDGGETEGRERRQAQSPTGEGSVASEWSGKGRGLSGPDLQGCVVVRGVWPPFMGGRAEARGTSYSLSGHRRPVA